MILALCLALGMSRRRLLEELDSAELSTWQAWFRLEPEPALRADLRAGMVAAAVVNMLGARGTAARAEDFSLGYRAPATEQDVDTAVRAIAEAFGRVD
jgi:hypothetical protein